MPWTQVSYLYDGTYAGFLTCVFDSFRHREEPADFTPFSEAAASFYPQRAVETDREKARRVYRSLDQFGREGKRWAVRGFLTCSGKPMTGLRVREDGLLRHLAALDAPREPVMEQLSLFDFVG